MSYSPLAFSSTSPFQKNDSTKFFEECETGQAGKGRPEAASGAGERAETKAEVALETQALKFDNDSASAKPKKRLIDCVLDDRRVSFFDEFMSWLFDNSGIKQLKSLVAASSTRNNNAAQSARNIQMLFRQNEKYMSTMFITMLISLSQFVQLVHSVSLFSLSSRSSIDGSYSRIPPENPYSIVVDRYHDGSGGHHRPFSDRILAISASRLGGVWIVLRLFLIGGLDCCHLNIESTELVHVYFLRLQRPRNGSTTFSMIPSIRPSLFQVGFRGVFPKVHLTQHATNSM